MRKGLAMALVGMASLTVMSAFGPEVAAQTSPVTPLGDWGGGLELDSRVLDELGRFDHDGASLSEPYRRQLAGRIRAEVFHRVDRAVDRIRTDGCEPYLSVSFDEPPLGEEPKNQRTRSEVEEAFEESLLRIEMVACLERGTEDPESVLSLYTDPDFRRSAEGRIERIWNRAGLTCVATEGVTGLLDPSRACNRIDRFTNASLAAEHSQVVSNLPREEGPHQTVYFKESVKTFVRVPGGLALHYIHYSRTPDLGRISRWIGEGKVREAEERKVAALREALAR